MKKGRINKNIKRSINGILENEIKPMVKKDLLKKRLSQRLSEQSNFLQGEWNFLNEYLSQGEKGIDALFNASSNCGFDKDKFLKTNPMCVAKSFLQRKECVPAFQDVLDIVTFGACMAQSSIKNLVDQFLNEAKDSYNFPGKVETDKTLKTANSQNSEAMKLVAGKIKDYLNFKNNSHPDFPHQNNSKTDYESPMYRNDTEQEEYIQDWRGMGLDDAQYQNNPDEGFKKRVRDYIEGASITGNETEKGVDGHQVGNVVPSKLGKNVLKKVKRKYDRLKSDEWDEAIPNRYGNQKPNPNYMVSESKKPTKSLIIETIREGFGSPKN